MIYVIQRKNLYADNGSSENETMHSRCGGSGAICEATHSSKGKKLANKITDRLCGLVVSVADYKHRGPGFDSRALLTIFLRELGLERGPLSLVIG
jgi:hypothetical protein